MKELKHMQKVLNTGMFTQRQHKAFCASKNTGVQHFTLQQRLQPETSTSRMGFSHFQHQQIQSLSFR